MAQITLNNGATANDGQGDTLRDAADKINSNFTELYGADSDGVSALDAVKAELAASTDFADFKSKIAAL